MKEIVIACTPFEPYLRSCDCQYSKNFAEANRNCQGKSSIYFRFWELIGWLSFSFCRDRLKFIRFSISSTSRTSIRLDISEECMGMKARLLYVPTYENTSFNRLADFTFRAGNADFDADYWGMTEERNRLFKVPSASHTVLLQSGKLFLFQYSYPLFTADVVPYFVPEAFLRPPSFNPYPLPGR